MSARCQFYHSLVTMGFHNEVVDLDPAPEDILLVWGKDVSEENLDKFFGQGENTEPANFPAGGLWSSKPPLVQSPFSPGALGKSRVFTGVSGVREKKRPQTEKGLPAGKFLSPSKIFCPSGGLEDIINFNSKQGLWSSIGSLQGQDRADRERSGPLAVF